MRNDQTRHDPARSIDYHFDVVDHIGFQFQRIESQYPAATGDDDFQLARGLMERCVLVESSEIGEHDI